MASPFRLLCWALIAVALSSPLGAQPAPDRAPPTIEESIDVRVVNVETVVTDSRGKRVRNLKAEDFRLLVDGKEVPVEYFTEVVDGQTARPAGENAGPAAPLPPEEPVARCFLIFLDDSFAVGHQRDAVLTRLQEDLKMLRPVDRMAVLAFDGVKIDVLSPWTGDAGALARALEAARRREAQGGQKIAQHRSLTADVAATDEAAALLELTAEERAFLRSWLAPRVSPEARTQLGRTAPAIAAALRAFPAPPGRKAMLLVSGGWSFTVAPRLLADVLEAANRLGYTLYPVDAANPTPEVARFLDGFAARTGGKVVNATLREDAFHQMMEDSGSYYWLGFTPSWKGDDRRHEVTIQVKRPGLTARARTSFSDISHRVETALQAEGVMFFGGAPEQHKLIVQLGAARPAGRAAVEVPVTLGVPVDSLVFTPGDKGGYVADVPLAIVVVDTKGGRSDLPAARLRIALPQVPGGAGFARFQTTVKLRRAPQKLVFTVQDAGQGGALWGEAEFKP